MRTQSLLCFIVLFFTCKNTVAQERENKSLPVISNEVLWSLDTATGWSKGTDGQWLEGKNKIQDERLGSKDTGKFNEGLFKLGFDNFQKLEIRKVNVEGRNFLILIKKFLSHKYAEPMDFKDHSVPRIVFIVFEENSGIISHDNKASITIFYRGIVDVSENYISDISSAINKMAIQYPWIRTSEGTASNLYFYYKLSDTDKSVSRFVFLTNKDELSEHFFLPIPRLFNLSRKALNDYYFEVPASKTKKLADLLIKS